MKWIFPKHGCCNNDRGFYWLNLAFISVIKQKINTWNIGGKNNNEKIIIGVCVWKKNMGKAPPPQKKKIAISPN